MTPSDSMILIAARVLSDKAADACGVDRNDQWAEYAEQWRDDAREMLEACGAVDLLEALLALGAAVKSRGIMSTVTALSVADTAITKATGGAA